jgi:hypothetical protein
MHRLLVSRSATNRAAAGSNSERVVVGYDGSMCGLQGHLLGGLGDPDGNNADADLAVHVTGVVDNTPPTARTTS